VVVFVISSMLT